MIRLGLSDQQLATLRFTVSPLMHVVQAVLWIRQHPEHGWPARRWSRVSPGTRELLLNLIDPSTHSIPDFLNPLTDQYRPTVETELAAVAATPLEQLREELRLVYRLGPVNEVVGRRLGAEPAVADSWRKEPMELAQKAWDGETEPLLTAVQAALLEAWQVLLAPTWPLVRSVTETDVMYRLQLIRTAGMSSSALELFDGEEWDGKAAHLDSHLDLDLTHVNCRIILAPSVLMESGRALIGSCADLVVGYPCRGRGAIIGPHATGETAGQQAPVVLGTSQVLGTPHRLLVALEVPQAGHGLAARLGLSKATVSYHLGRLHSSGLVERRRLGREVYYARTPAAEKVIGPPDVRPTPS